MEKLAIQGGAPAFDPAQIPEDLFRWPIYTQEDEDAILSVTRAGSFSGYDITEKFQKAWSEYQGCRETIACCNGSVIIPIQSAESLNAGIAAGILMWEMRSC